MSSPSFVQKFFLKFLSMTLDIKKITITCMNG